MILFTEDEFSSNIGKFHISVFHKNTWEAFVFQYGKVIITLNNSAISRRYELNVKSYPYLFLLRHYCELKLKSILASRGIPVPNSHVFSDILILLPDCPSTFTEALEKITFDEDGSCFRYMYNKDLEVGPLYGKRIEFLPFYDVALETHQGSEYYLDLGIFKPFATFLNWEFTFHFNEVDTLGQFRSSYDDMTRFILKQIIDDKLSVNDVYLPLLFFIRHSVELALKDGLIGLLHIQTEAQEKKIRRLMHNEHKISKLFATFIAALAEVGINQLPLELQQQFTDYQSQTEQLKEAIHLLDANSRYFKYPFDKDNQHLNIKERSVVQIVYLFLKVDAFLTFTVDILKGYNIVPYSEKEIEQMIGFSPDLG